MVYKLQVISEIGDNFSEEHPELHNLSFSEHFALVRTESRIELRQLDGDRASLYVDFVGGTLGYRRLHGGGAGQAVVKAVCSRNKTMPQVIDATAGMGRDAFVLASLGCHVLMFERNPVVRVLLADGLSRAYNDSGIGNMLKERLILSPLKSITEMKEDKCCDAVYLDPMFPVRRSSALVKKDMRIFHQIVGLDEDSDELLKHAFRLARSRVAVKRPKSAPFLGGFKTSNCVETKSHRFDLYHP
jgi:16S rRNA (guanine1516-N2)-methyltransferase